MNNLNYTNHANQRMQQRGINKEIVSIILKEADIGGYCKKNAYSMYVSRKKILKLVEDKKIKPSQADRLNGVVILESNGVLLTTFHKKKRKKNN